MTPQVNVCVYVHVILWSAMSMLMMMSVTVVVLMVLVPTKLSMVWSWACLWVDYYLNIIQVFFYPSRVLRNTVSNVICYGGP